jgi:hypothetical protein
MSYIDQAPPAGNGLLGDLLARISQYFAGGANPAAAAIAPGPVQASIPATRQNNQIINSAYGPRRSLMPSDCQRRRSWQR